MKLHFSRTAWVAAWIIVAAILLIYLIGPPQPPPDRPFSVTSTTGRVRFP